MIRKIIDNIRNRRTAGIVPNKHISIDDTIEKSSDEARTAIYTYVNMENRAEKELKDVVMIDYMLGFIADNDRTFIPPQLKIASMNDNIIRYLNRSSQLLSSKLVEDVEILKDPKRYAKIARDSDGQGPYRFLDTMLFASNMIMLTNNLGANLFKQAASTIYGQYDPSSDKNTITVQKLGEQLMVDCHDIYEALFENNLEEYRGILMPLRNTAGHSDINQKIEVPWGENPQIVYNGERQDAYPLIRKITLAYLDKTAQLYHALVKDIQTNGVRPHITEYMQKYLETYRTEGQIRKETHDRMVRDKKAGLQAQP